MKKDQSHQDRNIYKLSFVNQPICPCGHQWLDPVLHRSPQENVWKPLEWNFYELDILPNVEGTGKH